MVLILRDFHVKTLLILGEYNPASATKSTETNFYSYSRDSQLFDPIQNFRCLKKEKKKKIRWHSPRKVRLEQEPTALVSYLTAHNHLKKPQFAVDVHTSLAYNTKKGAPTTSGS